VGLTVTLAILAAGGVSFGLVCGLWLWRWEKLLRRSRITVAYKNKVKMNRPLIDWLTWCQRVDKDKHATGQVVFMAGGVRIAVLQPIARNHGKTVTKQVDKPA
jgi:hypothetical protein